ncbi:MAG: methyltransferase domain-containing protein [Candidatus Omnitrophota bacterium]
MDIVKCNLCGSQDHRLVYDIKISSPDQGKQEYKITAGNLQADLKLLRCAHCGLVFADPLQSRKFLKTQYSVFKDELYISEEKGRRIAARAVLKKISRFKKPGELLEIGCAAGFLLDEAVKLGWKTHGIEPCKWMSDFAKNKLGLGSIFDSLEQAAFRAHYFDLIILADVLEHLDDPRSELERLRKLLKPGGILYISTPDIDSFLSRLLKAKWWGIQYGHLFYFSRKTLSKMLGLCGFKPLSYSAYLRVFSVSYWQQRLASYSWLLSKVFGFLAKCFSPLSGLWAVSFFDQVEVICCKKRSLSFIDTDEFIAEQVPAKRMKTIVVLPAYNAEKTLAMTLRDIPRQLVDDIILVDDASRDNTVTLAESLGLKVFRHSRNSGYGANQKTCYTKALAMGAEIIVMVHPDYQYDPAAISSMVQPIQNGSADAVFGSRMIAGGALEGGMPLWKHNTNILLTALENVILGTYFSEYHSGFRAYSAKYLRTVNFMANSDNFVFDNEILVQGLLHNLRIEEVPIKTRYFEEASTIKLLPAVIYGMGILNTLLKYILHTRGLIRFKQFD